MRVTSELWVSALIRRAEAAGAFAMVVRKGAAEAGAIFVIVNDLQGGLQLHAPAPQTDYSLEHRPERRFECILGGGGNGEGDGEGGEGGGDSAATTSDDIAAKLEREKSFDPDIWIVEIEDKQGRAFIDM